MTKTLKFDEDTQKGLVQALRGRGIDVVVAWEVGMRQHDDEAQLALATSLGRVLYGCNVKDYFRIHGKWLAQGKSHAGIVLVKQQTYPVSVRQELRRLLRLMTVKSANEMTDQIEFLSDWGD
ncbi:MAG TPA: DUF5615 family PIN-like protein [Blastocatellia bacterium]|nr:DUF5615 family PIN-like protein [Blastocatellia bacterium]HMV83043.1 DUF5615 family PIN-like protein [Blastocatellia bacterium]HMX27988.1 DUF5615 family PIN-like protein [Blastocatellia bacterium]HMY71773.1 DUF5615 family PIN-like protein [Blastocatellia bacterium]HMZ17768.1 DUF5615 family PIN-like protein [Blastocatellia bacterium]